MFHRGPETLFNVLERRIFNYRVNTQIELPVRMRYLYSYIHWWRQPAIFVSPMAIERTVGREKVLKIVQWALYMSTFVYRIGHVPGKDNHMTFIMKRWLKGFRSFLHAFRSLKESFPVHSTLPVNAHDWPNRYIIRAAQSAQDRPPSVLSAADDDGLICCDGRVWLPQHAEHLKLKLITKAHFGTSGHQTSPQTGHSIWYYSLVCSSLRFCVC